ncbi:M12 family metallo-peptidase [Tahibacter amnicola]|uniref:M12 family metallo-peptidase n=1 Tax=Tahibacter amnicola TaxID=2976241 RepID=A0ABY6BDR8_9GAMM|nr:M12 family metallo-peptidase [Tahibacter amnicola]UXI66761.1 M12 family metallo-peptidase [Tahibacter amnicola]
MKSNHHNAALKSVGAGLAVAIFLALSTPASAGGVVDVATKSRVAAEVDAMRDKSRAYESVSLFGKQAPVTADRSAAEGVFSGAIVDLDLNAVAALKRGSPRTLTLRLPTHERGMVELELIANDIFAPNFQVETSSGKFVDVPRGMHYRGIIKGDPTSVAAISIFDNEVTGTFSASGDGNYVVGRLEGKNSTNRHIVYAERNLKDFKNAPQCGMDKVKGSQFEDQTTESFADFGKTPGTDNTLATKCATQWLEAEYDVFQNKGSVAAVTSYLTGVFNNSNTLYANDGISMKLERIFVWDTPDPYSGSNSTATLSSFQNSRAGSFTGTIAQLVTFRGIGGGVAAGFTGVCNSNRNYSMAVSGINSSYSNVPTYSWTVNVVTHEAGHLLGSRHTHACVWNGNSTAIDSCSGFVEGNCAMPGNPSDGGTIMSYCHLANVGMNFNKGFGPQPAARISSAINNGSCLSSTCGTDTGATALTNHNPNTFSIGQGTKKYFKIDVPAGTQAIAFRTWGGTGDADIYVKQGSNPTTTDNVCKGTGPNSTEVCRINNPAAGTWYVMVDAYSALSNVVTAASFAGGCSGTLELGYLTGTNNQNYLPLSSGSYTSSTSGTHRGVAAGPSAGADFDMELQKQNGTSWAKVNTSGGTGPTTAEDVSYSGTAGTYRWRHYSYSGAGGYSLCITKPN